MIPIGSIISTSYGTGPYILQSMHGPCNCGEYIESLDNPDCTSEDHYHLLLTGKDISDKYYLGGYALKDDTWTSEWNNDYLIIEIPKVAQFNLF